MSQKGRGELLNNNPCQIDDLGKSWKTETNQSKWKQEEGKKELSFPYPLSCLPSLHLVLLNRFWPL